MSVVPVLVQPGVWHGGLVVEEQYEKLGLWPLLQQLPVGSQTNLLGAASRASNAKHRGHHGPRLEMPARILRACGEDGADGPSRKRERLWQDKQTVAIRFSGETYNTVQEFSHGSRSNCRYPQLISVSS